MLLHHGAAVALQPHSSAASQLCSPRFHLSGVSYVFLSVYTGFLQSLQFPLTSSVFLPLRKYIKALVSDSHSVWASRERALTAQHCSSVNMKSLLPDC